MDDQTPPKKPRFPPDADESVTKWGIYQYFDFLGWVELTENGLVTGGPEAELFASLPKRLRGVTHVGSPNYKPTGHKQENETE
jgi:hypothetical protein